MRPPPKANRDGRIRKATRPDGRTPVGKHARHQGDVVAAVAPREGRSFRWPLVMVSHGCVMLCAMSRVMLARCPWWPYPEPQPVALVTIHWYSCAPPSTPYPVPTHQAHPHAPLGGPTPLSLFTLPYFLGFWCTSLSLPGAWRLRRWRLRWVGMAGMELMVGLGQGISRLAALVGLTPLHRHLAGVEVRCCHRGGSPSVTLTLSLT